MKIIRKEANASGAYPPILEWTSDTPPEGCALIPDDLDVSAFSTHAGFVTLTIEGDIVTGMVANTDAYEVWAAEQPEPEEPQPTAEEKIALLQAQIKAQSTTMDFYEDCIAEMAETVYA